jgi:hypothetical protein
MGIHKTSLVDGTVKSESDEKSMDSKAKQEWTEKWNPTINHGEKKPSKKKCCIL